MSGELESKGAPLLQQSSKGDPGRSLLLELRAKTSREHGRSWEKQGKARKGLRRAEVDSVAGEGAAG